MESMKFLHYLYDENKSLYVGLPGYDAFSPQYNWVTPRYLAIDQGTIAPMIENYRTGLLWNLFMNAAEIKPGLVKLGFHSENIILEKIKHIIPVLAFYSQQLPFRRRLLMGK
jgi:hypothetical protein